MLAARAADPENALGDRSRSPGICCALRRIETELAAAPASPPVRPSLMSLTALQSLVCTALPGCLGYPVPPSRSSFPTHVRGLPAVPSPKAFAVGSSSRALRCPPEFLEPLPARPEPDTFHGPAFPHRDINVRSPRSRASRARSVPSSTFHTSSTVSSSTRLAGLFHPAATSRVRSSGVLPRQQPYGLVARRCPLVVAARLLLPVARERQKLAARLRGFAPLANPLRHVVV